MRENPKEAGGISIVVALILLSVVTVASMGMSRASLREMLIVGNESTSRKAFETADSAMDWTLTWGSPYSNTTADPAAASLQASMTALLAAIYSDTNRSAYTDTSGTLRTVLTGATIGGNMTPSTSSYLQSTAVQPSFDAELRYLGAYQLSNTTQSSLIKSSQSLWLLQTTGRANIAGTNQSFISRRESVVQYIN